MVRIRLFGGVGVVTDGGEPVDVGPTKCQTVLAALALSAGSAVPVSRLVDLVWGEQPPRTAAKTLQSYVTRLRKGLGSDAIVRTGAAYRLDVAADAVDVARFKRHLDAGDIEAALREWTDPPLAGLDAPGLTAVADALVEQWLGAVERDLQGRIGTDPAGAIGPLTELTASHPFREGLWALLMTALYRVGRQGDALAAFHAARQHLVDQLGVEPGPRLRELETQILEHDEQLGGDAPSTAAASGRPKGTVTFGFCEVEGSSRLWATHRQKAAAAMARLDDLVRATADRCGGHVFAASGDTFGVAFHRADDAAAWATQLQATVHSEPWPGGVEVQLQIALHSGETQEQAKGYFGPAVNTAAYLAASGHGGQTLISAVTAGLLDRSDLRDLGAYRLDGVVAEQHIFQLGHSEHPPLRTGERRRGNLPLQRARLIGREEELDVINDALTRSPVVTLVGPGGVGKTRLAQATARRFDGDRREAWLIELSSITLSADVPRAVADTLGVTECPGPSLTQAIVTSLQPRNAVLVLDNCEHVIDGAAALAQAVTEGCPNVGVLATSREGLGLATEQLVAVAPLDPAGPGAELFNERARALSNTFDPHADPPAVEELCRRLDGLPLAIELAAARTRTLTPADLLGRLDDRFRLLTRGRRSSVERHRTLRAAIQWSYDLLTPNAQLVFQRLTVFTGTFDLAAAEQVTADADPHGVPVDEALGDLVEQSMLVAESGPFGRRFRLLETMRQFAAERLSERGDADAIAGRHARWCLDQVTEIHQLLTGPAEIEGVARLGELWPNLRAAVHHACAAGDHDLADALVRPVVAEITLRRQSEIGDWAERILAITPPSDDDRVTFWTTWAAHRYMHNGDAGAYEELVGRHGNPDHALLRYTHAYLYEDSPALHRWSPEAVAWLRRHGEGHLAALTELAGVASGLMGSGRFEQFDTLVSALADRYRTEGPPTLLSLALIGLGYSASFQGKPAEADEHFDELARLQLPERTFSLHGPIAARAAFRRGNRMQAFQLLRTHVDELLETDNTDVARLACVEFVTMMATMGRIPDAERVMGYLETTGGFGALASRTLVADAADRIAQHRRDKEPGPRPDPDAHHALAFMRDVLNELADDQQIAT